MVGFINFVRLHKFERLTDGVKMVHVDVEKDVHETLKKLQKIFFVKSGGENYSLSDVIKIILNRVEVDLTQEDIDNMKKELEL